MKPDRWLFTWMFAAVACASLWALSSLPSGQAQPTPEGKKQQAQVGTIEDTKKKGFEGVDFSYDLFGAPPGQDPQKSFEHVMKKDMAEKSAVMKQQRQLLQDRYELTCRSADGMTMTNGKPQPIGPTLKLPSGMTWDQLAKMSAN